jgi:3-deoxy-D-manno-octulosonic acid kinase
MNLKLEQVGARVIVYDAECIEHPGGHLFDPEYWRKLKAVESSAPGRGKTLMLNTPFGPAVLRIYLRGGWAARWSRDRYLFTGFGRSRPLREARLLEKLLLLGMPVPQPLAAQCTRGGLSYTGALLMRRIMPAVALAELLATTSPQDVYWFHTGRCIRRFHEIGLVHPDLNARNILVSHPGSAGSGIYLIDFDRAFFRMRATRLFKSNLLRLRRSLLKLWPAQHAGALEPCWEQLMTGYSNEAGHNNGSGCNSGIGYNAVS